jgi:conjugal transfer pilus assembly protein TraU
MLKFIFIISLLMFAFQNVIAQVVPGGGVPNTPEQQSAIDKALCPSSNILGAKMITDVCWEGLFPMYLGGVRFGGKSKYAPNDRANDRACFCEGDIAAGQAPLFGVTLGMWQPTYLMTVVKKPYCFPELNGAQLGSELGLVSRYNIGNQDQSLGDDEDESNQSMYSWHLASFPLMHIMELFTNFSCQQSGYISFDLIWISETLPHHYDPSLAAFIVPESILFANPLALPFIAVDCVASSIDEPMDELFFVNGCWGRMYPLTGDLGSAPNKVEGKSLIATRALYFLSRIGVLKRTMGDDVLCAPKKMPVLKKSQYRMQQIWPMSESSSDESICTGEGGCGGNNGSTSPDTPAALDPNSTGVNLTGEISANQIDQIKLNSLNGTCTHVPGQTSFAWGIWRDAKQPDFASYLIYQWKDCCLDLLKTL